MNLRERKKALTPILKALTKSSKLSLQSYELRKVAIHHATILAKKSCPYKKGQLFQKGNSKVWAVAKGVTASCTERVSYLPKDYEKAPYVIECRRATVKGVINKNADWIFINGVDVGSKWIVCD